MIVYVVGLLWGAFNAAFALVDRVIPPHWPHAAAVALRVLTLVVVFVVAVVFMVLVEFVIPNGGVLTRGRWKDGERPRHWAPLLSWRKNAAGLFSRKGHKKAVPDGTGAVEEPRGPVEKAPEAAGPDASMQRLLEYVRAQEAAEGRKRWTDRVARWAGYVALLAFFFGVGNFTDIRQHLDPQPSYEDTSISIWVQSDDSHCKQVSKRTQLDLGPVESFADAARQDREVLDLRVQIYGDFSDPSVNMSGSVLTRAQAVVSDFAAADDDVQTAIDAATAGDANAYTEALGRYHQDNAMFLRDVGSFSFTQCSFDWPIAQPPFTRLQPNPQGL